MTTFPPADREDTKARCREAAFQVPTTSCGHADCPHTEHHRPGRKIIHSMIGGMGADWDLDHVLAAIDRADLVTWQTDDPYGHPLLVNDGGRWINFQVPATQRVP